MVVAAAPRSSLHRTSGGGEAREQAARGKRTVITATCTRSATLPFRLTGTTRSPSRCNIDKCSGNFSHGQAGEM